MLSNEKMDLAIIGAGWYGLTAAKTYLDLHPCAHIIIYDSASTIGGVWAEERLYPGLRTNHQLGAYEHSDFPMTPEKYGIKHGEHIPGGIVHRYLADFADHFKICERIRFNTEVETAEHQEHGGWLLTVRQDNIGRSQVFVAKLIVATGLTSEPSLPELPGQENFKAPIFHVRSFAKYAKTLETARNVCVIGATKSGFDVVYQYASRGISVEWVIRESGHGPCWMTPVRVTPFKLLLESLPATRFLTWFSPCVWGSSDGFPLIRKILHSTRLGRFVVDGFWYLLRSDVLSSNKYDSHPEMAKLKPQTDPFDTGASVSILNYERNFFDLVKNGTVKIHVSDIDTLAKGTVNLENGIKIPADALVCCTGWERTPSVKFLPKCLEKEMGLPHTIGNREPRELIERADVEILSRFPRLRKRPEVRALNRKEMEESKLAPYRLYRFMVPPGSIGDGRDVAFAGYVMTIATPICAQLQALWISAFFNGEVKIELDAEEVLYETILHSRFGYWRCSAGFGEIFPDLVFDWLPYFDLLLLDLGLKRYRKTGWMGELFGGYRPSDYRGLVREWLESRR